jgi:hypothetical protein
MRPIDMGPLVGAATAATAALYLMSGRLPAPYNRMARRGAVAVYGVALLGVLVYIGLWILRVEF